MTKQICLIQHLIMSLNFIVAVLEIVTHVNFTICPRRQLNLLHQRHP
jgi:hypothetical protein